MELIAFDVFSPAESLSRNKLIKLNLGRKSIDDEV